jgi:CCR4-NOT transcription complex subunit 6
MIKPNTYQRAATTTTTTASSTAEQQGYSLQQQQQQQQAYSADGSSPSNPMNSSPYGYPAYDGSPPNNVMSSVYWQHQVQLAQLSRQTNSSHNYARSAAVSSRGNTGVPMTVYELATQIVDQQQQQEQPVPQLHPNGTPVKGSASTGMNGNRRQKKVPLEEERQRRINEEVNKQYWTALDLSGQGIYRVAPKLFKYHFLQRLYLNHNKLTEVPPAITQLKQLKVLDLSDNAITALPAELGLVYTLRYLFLFDNKIQSLPYEFGNLFQLDMLGIEGNPINEHTRDMLAKEGTRGVIIDLRERAPIKATSPPREWLVFEDKQTTAKQQQQQEDNNNNDSSLPDPFSVMSYNILCDHYATPQLYGYTPSWALGWKYRSELIRGEILNYEADLVCLQEVDGNNYEKTWVPQLAEKGYKGVFWPKTRSRTMSENDAKRVDGCATFYKTSKFKLVERHCSEYNSLALRREDFKKTADIYNRVMNKDNIAVISVFELVNSPGQLVIVANTHLHWDPAFNDVKLVQVALLLEELDRMASKYASSTSSEGSKYPKYTDKKQIPMLICGDYNSVVDSGVYQLFSQGGVPAKHPDMEGRAYGKFTEEGMSHPFNLKSAYADIGELPFTNFTPNFVEVIDYIWYSTGTLNVKGVLGPMDKDYVNQFIAIPNAHHPSDHIPLVSEFGYNKVKEPTPKPQINWKK